MLGMHSSITALPGELDWPGLLGGVWVRGRSMHPPRSQTTIRLAGSEHPIAADLADIAVDDERYSYLQTEPDIQVLYEHDHDGRRHPVVWARPTDRYRAVYYGRRPRSILREPRPPSPAPPVGPLVVREPD